MIRRLHWRKGPIDKKEMKRLNGNTKYQLACFLYELFLFFISSFLLFPSHIKRNILCFVYSDDHEPTFVHPYLKEEICSIAMLLIFIHPSLLIRMSFAFKSFLNMISLVALSKIKLIRNLLRSQNLLPSPL